tara:strand:+ start:3483 stop:3938 length:456 start_codon:yes stop_codon:yes gene_type:complete
MPTSQNEAKAIQDIINEFLTPEEAQEITTRLNQEVGENTDNDSLRVSLEMLKGLYAEEKPPSRRQRVMLTMVVGGHMAVLGFNIIAMFTLPFYTPWYVALPIITLLINLMFSPIACPLTKLESRIRRSMKYPEVRYFVKYYFVDPLRKLRG